MITMLFTGYLTNGVYIFYALLCAIGAGIYIIIDLIMIMIPGGFDLDDYILAALMLYIDIIRLFFYILIAFGSKKWRFTIQETRVSTRVTPVWWDSI